VNLLIKRSGITENFENEITREEIKIKSVPYSGIIRDGIGSIRLNSFTENAGRDIGNALKELKAGGDLQGIVLDLRGNPGGLLNEAVNVSNVFVDKGKEIVSTRGKVRESVRSYKANNEAIDKDVPLVVLVSSGSASASEIVSGTIQDLDRGIIIGQRTFGKGLVQTTRQLPYNTQLKITTAKYYIPSGRCIQALDYSHRNEDGSVGKVPDSLVTTFRTKAGRIVYYGGGVLPDIVMQQEKLSNISASLLSKGIIFDFATDYVRKNPVYATTDVNLTDADFKEFQEFISSRSYDYSTKSEKSLDEFAKNAEEEKYYSELKNDIDQLKLKLAHDKQEDVLKNRNEIIELLEEEIAARYFYQVGRIRKSLAHDPELEKAIEILKDKSYYDGILSGVIKADASTEEQLKK
jgi:carboxyl-terminal processing protease